MLGELAHMESMVESVLHFLRNSHTGRQAVALDLATSLQAICDQFADTGREVGYHGPITPSSAPIPRICIGR